MRRNQLGVSLGGLMAVSVVLIAIIMLGLKVMPAYLEFFAIKKAVTTIGTEKRGGTVKEIRAAYDAHTVIDGIESVKSTDLEITKDGGDLVVGANYRKEIPLFGNVGLYVDFHASSKQ